MEQQTLTPRKAFSRLGWGYCVLLAVLMGTRALWDYGPAWFLGPDNALTASESWVWLGNIIPMYCFALPACWLVIRTVPKAQLPSQGLGAERFWRILPICFFVMYSGNILGMLVSWLLSGGTAVNIIQDVVMDDHPLKVVAVVLLAPWMEELMFRKLLVDRAVIYGEKIAVILSGLLFGLFHRNMFQFFYAFGLGILLAYMYIRSGRLRYPVLVHMLINFIGAVLAPAVVKLGENAGITEETMELTYAQQWSVLAVYGLFLAIIAAFVFGLVFFIKYFKKAHWEAAPGQLDRGTVMKTVYLNVGIALFILLNAGLTVANLFIQ